MRIIRQTLEDMKLRLENVETTLRTLNECVSESNARQEESLAHMRADAEQMRAHAEQMRAHAEQMRAHAEQMQVSSEQMRLDVARNTAAFDQAVTGSVENLEGYRRGMAIVIEYLTKKVSRNSKKQRALEKRVKAIEDRLAG